jgi:hypothetical protein
MTDNQTAIDAGTEQAIRAAQGRVVETWNEHTDALSARDQLLRRHDVHNGGKLTRAQLAAITGMTEVAVGRRITMVLRREGVDVPVIPRSKAGPARRR